jgi:hypothetical protein
LPFGADFYDVTVFRLRDLPQIKTMKRTTLQIALIVSCLTCMLLLILDISEIYEEIVRIWCMCSAAAALLITMLQKRKSGVYLENLDL